MLGGDIPQNGHRERAVVAAAEARLRALAEPDRVPFLQRFFRTAPGGYGEGDRSMGVRVSAVRKLARKRRHTPLAELLELLQSPYHEARLLALLGMAEQFRRGEEQAQAARRVRARAIPNRGATPPPHRRDGGGPCPRPPGR